MSAENQGPSDDELLNEVLSDETTDSPVVAGQPEQVEEPNEPETLEAVASDDGGKPPIPPKPEWRLKEDAERARIAEADLARERAEAAALRQRLEALERSSQKEQPKAEKPSRPDPLLDPDGYAAAIRAELREEALNERREESLQRAAETHPAEFKEAYAAAQQAVDPALRARMQSSRDPGKTLLDWHREQKVKAEVGNDPNAWLEKKLEERLKDPAFLAKAAELARGSAQQNTQANGRPRIDLAPSLNGASRANTALKAGTEDVSDDELFRQLAG